MVTVSVEFRVTNPAELLLAVDPLVARVAGEIRDAAEAGTPQRTGKLRAGWRSNRQRRGFWLVTNRVRYGRYVEYGTKRTPAVAMFGQSIARARGRYGE